MSVMKSIVPKRIWLGTLLMVLTLLVANGACALMMSGGLIDHHLMLQAACISWGMASLVAGRTAGREKGTILPGGLVVPMIVFLLSLLVSVALRKTGAGDGVWWKCGLCVVTGAVLGAMTTGSKRKKHGSSGGKRRNRNSGNIKRHMAK